MAKTPFTCVFTNDCHNRLDEIVDRIVKPRLWFSQGKFVDYPDIGDWAQKTYVELNREIKRAFIALINGRLVGVIVYQRDKVDPGVLELKHLSIDEMLAGRRIASFLLRQAEIEGVKKFHPALIRCDVKVFRIAVQSFLRANHYQLITATDLYGLKAGLDAVYEKKAEVVWRKILGDRRILLS